MGAERIGWRGGGQVRAVAWRVKTTIPRTCLLLLPAYRWLLLGVPPPGSCCLYSFLNRAHSSVTVFGRGFLLIRRRQRRGAMSGGLPLPPHPPPPGPRALPLFARGGVLWGYIPATSRACHSAVGPALPCTRVSLRPRRAAIKNKPAGRWSSPPCPPPPLPLVASHTSQAPPACPRCPPSAHPVRQHPHPMRAFPCPPAEDGLLAGPGGARVCDEPAAPAQLPFAPEEVRAPRLILGAVK